jgi:hypothetical protein
LILFKRSTEIVAFLLVDETAGLATADFNVGNVFLIATEFFVVVPF